ncbi:type II toxin-antitoxin system HicA family toxin [Methanoplanus limicola]
MRLFKVTPQKPIKITLPLHNEIDRGTLISILNSAEISKKEFLDLI